MVADQLRHRLRTDDRGSELMDEVTCATCNQTGAIFMVACADWRQCPAFALSRAAGTLPETFPDVPGGPTESDRQQP